MNNESLTLRHQRLLLRSAQLRLDLKNQVQAFKPPLSLADRTLSGLQWLARHPLWPLGAVLVVLVLRPRRVVLWGGRIWWAWATLRRVLRWSARNLASPSMRR